MTTLSDTTLRYRIVLRGECSMLLAGIADELTIESGHGQTCILVSVRDESGLYGLLDRLQDLALHIVSLTELGGNPLGGRAAAGG